MPPIILALYVDDTMVAFHPSLESEWISDKERLSSIYPITDLGICEWILNMKVEYNHDGSQITLSQRAYIEKLLLQFGLTDCNPAHTPSTLLDLTHPDQLHGQPLSIEQHMQYRSMVGALLYAANTTRMDIAYVVGVLSRFVSAPMHQHLIAAKHVIRYL